MRTAKNSKLSLPFGVFVLVFCLLNGTSWGQLNVDATNTPFVIDFSTTVSGVNNGAFNPGANGGNVTNNTPAAGQLDGDAWHFINDGAAINSNATFPAGTQGGGRNAAFSIAPGASANNAAGMGWYGFTIGGTNRALGWQPNGAFATDGAITLKMKNSTGVPITTLDISYNVYEINNSNNSNTVRFFHSLGANSWWAGNEVTSLQVTSVAGEPAATINVTGTTVAGTSVTITHASGANSAINNNDIVFLNNGVANTQLRRVSGYVTGKTATTTTIEIDPAVGAAAATHGAGGQFTVAPVITHNRTISLNVSIPNGNDYFLRWYLGGTGEDEIAIDNITIIANPLGLQLTNTGVSTIIDFDNTLTNVNNGTFTAPANICVDAPAAGQLDAGAWAFTNDAAPAAPGGAAAWGGTTTGGQGVSNGGVTTAGWYGFNVPDPSSIDPTATTRTLGWQSDDAFATAGMITLRMNNVTGTTLQDFRISFTIWQNNNTGVSNRVRVYVSHNNTDYYITSVTHTSPAAPDALGWQGTLYTITANNHIFALSIPNGGNFYLRFYLDHASGTGQGDEMAIDDITIIPSASPLNSINPNRDIVWTYDGFDYYDNIADVQDVDGDGVNDTGGFKGIKTIFGDFSTSPIELHGITTKAPLRYRTTNGHASLGWAGDWLSGVLSSSFSNVRVTRGKDGVGGLAKPTIPITSASQQRSIVNSGMYVEGGSGQTIGRRLQTSTGGYAFQYTATNPTNYTPCTTISNDCPAISPLRHNNDVRCITHITTAANQVAGDHQYWSHTNNVRFGAEGSTVWVGVMLRKNHNNNDPVFISLHKNTNVWDAGTGDDEIQIGYFGGTDPNGTDADGFRHWAVKVNNTLYKGTDVNSRITTAQMVNGSVTTGQPDAGTPEERVFDLLVVRIDFANGTPATPATIATLKGGLDNTYASNHRIQMWVIRDIARDNDSPNTDAYPLVPNPANYPSDQGIILDHLADNIADSDGNGTNDFDQYRSLNITVPATVDISFRSLAYYPGATPNASAMDEFRLGGSFNQAALNSPVVSLIRGLCSANGGTLGLQTYEGGDFGSAKCMDTNGNIDTSLPGCPGTTTSTATNGTQEVYHPTSTDVWGSSVNNSFLDGLYTLNNPPDHPSYPNTGTNAVIMSGGVSVLYPGGPQVRSISGSAYNYQLNTGSGPNDNNYLLGTQSRHSFGPAWIPFYDNSPHKNGYLMSINASYARSKFFDQTISGLCADTQYEFSIDIINVLRRTQVITNVDPNTLDWTYEGHAGGILVGTDICDAILEPGCAQMSRPGGGGSFVGLGSVTRGGTGASGTTSGSGGSNRNYSLNPEVDFALNDVPIYTVPVSIPTDAKWHRVGLTFVTKANLASAINLSVRNLAPGGSGNDLAIDNINFRPCGTFSQLLNESTVCDDDSSNPEAGKVWLEIKKAGLSFANARVRTQKWTPFATPISHLITGVTTGATTTVTVPDGLDPEDGDGTQRIPVGAIVSLYDLDGMGIPNGSQGTVTAKTANTVTFSYNSSSAGSYPSNVGVLRVVALPDAMITDISAANPITVTLTGGGTAIAVGTQVTFSGVAGMTGINGVSGRVISNSPTSLVVQVATAPGGTFNDAGGTEQIDLMQGSNDLNNNGIAEENEWEDVSFNFYDGKNYTAEPVTINIPGTFYESTYMPITPVALPRAITPYNVFYPNGTKVRAMYAGNEANLLDASGKCRFIAAGFDINCSILPVTGANLKARNTYDGIELTWRVLQEKTSATKYIIERSYDAQSFVAIADYPALDRIEHKYLDKAPFVGKNYYRVRIEEGNNIYYTNVASADWAEGNFVTIYPNPASESVNVVFSQDVAAETDVKVRIISTMGMELKDKNYRLQAGNRMLSIATNDLPNGLYLLEIQAGSSKVVHKLVVKH